MINTKTIATLIIMLVVAVSSNININAASLGFEKTSSIESVEIGNGINYERINGVSTNDSGTEKSQKVSYINVQKGSAEIVTWSKYGKSGIVNSSISKIAADYETKNPGYKVMAAINADYFSSNAPINAIIQNGDVLKYSNHQKYQSIAFNNDGSGLIKVKENTASNKYYLTIYAEDKVTPIKEVILNGYNVKPGANQTTVFYKYTSALSLSGTTSFEITQPDAYFNLASYFIKGQITNQITTLNENPIISTTDQELAEILKTNPYIRVQKMMTGDNEGYDNIIGVGSQPLVNGQILSNSEIGDQNVDFCAARAPRTSIGWTEDGDIILAAIDGRQASSGMNGVSLREEAAIMQSLGCNNAFNFDGGGSTEMIIRNGDTFKTVNSPSDGTSRAVTTAVLVVVPDVKVSLDVSEITKTAAKVSYDVKANGTNVSNVKASIIVNGKDQTGDGTSFYVKDLQEGEANFIALSVEYKKDNQTKTVVYEVEKVYTTQIEDPSGVVKVKPSNFNVTFERTATGFDAIVTCDDPSETLRKVYLVCDGEAEIAIRDIRGYVVNYPITSSVDMTFEVKFEYNLGSIKNTSEIYEENFTYQYSNEPSNFLVNFSKNSKKGFDVIVSYDDNGCTITKIEVLCDDEVIECVDGRASITKAEEKLYQIIVNVYYIDGTSEKMITVPGVYSYNYIKSGCMGFNVIEVLSTIILLTLSFGFIRIASNRKN